MVRWAMLRLIILQSVQSDSVSYCPECVVSIVGGGDTAGFYIEMGREHGANFTHVSTGGGAGMALMAGKNCLKLKVY